MTRLRAISSCSDTAIGQTQKSLPKVLAPLDGRGRGRVPARRAHVEPRWLKVNMASLWGNYVRSAFRSREACAAHFEVSFQTTCNWWDGLHAPASAIYARASLEDGSRLHAVMTGAR